MTRSWPRARISISPRSTTRTTTSASLPAATSAATRSSAQPTSPGLRVGSPCSSCTPSLPAPTPTPTRTPPTTTPTGGTDAHAGSTGRNASGHDIASHGNANGRAHHNAHGCCTTSLSDIDTDTYDCSRCRAHADTGSWGGGRCARIPYRHYRRHGASRRRGRRILLPGDEA